VENYDSINNDETMSLGSPKPKVLDTGADAILDSPHAKSASFEDLRNTESIQECLADI
jgi:hypothetical protein